jgi:trehalose 2-sulfotransferase
MQAETEIRRTPKNWTDEAFDFKQPTALRKSYIIASLPRSGSQFLCSELWRTGVLGAPNEYLLVNFFNHKQPMIASVKTRRRFLVGTESRLRSTSIAEYIAKLVACRTSPNGIFGLATHIYQLHEFLREYPALLEVMAPVTFIYTTRRNKIAQAVSMAKAYSTSAWTSQMRSNPAPPEYSKELIEGCLADLAKQELEWERWFASNQVTPFRVVYEDFAADRAGTIRSIMESLGVQNDEPAKVELPPVERQSDSTNKEWIARFEAETPAAADADPAGSADQAAATLAGGSKGFYERFIEAVSARSISPAMGFLNTKQSRQLFQVIVEQNRTLFENARVLELPSGDGRWCLAALDAGAARVVGVEADGRTVARTTKLFSKHGGSRELCEIINADIVPTLASFEPESFDLIMCVRYFEQLDPYQMFREFHRLRPRFIILDMRVAHGRGRVVRFALGRLQAGEADQSTASGILMAPTNGAISFLCDFFGFRCRSVDWQQMGITNWTGLHVYERGWRRTYVLERDR